VPLWPFAQSEIERGDGLLVDRLFAGEEPPPVEDEAGRRHVAARIAAGGFPGAFRRTPRSRVRFFEAYTDSVVGRDVPDVARTRDAGTVGRLLRLLAARSASLLRLESLARDLGVDRKTVERYLRILQDLMLVRIHPPWHPNLSHREVKSPKVYVTDTAMMAALIGASADRIATDPVVAGMAFETFVTMEMVKLSPSWAPGAGDQPVEGRTPRRWSDGPIPGRVGRWVRFGLDRRGRDPGRGESRWASRRKPWGARTRPGPSTAGGSRS
jgi:predicted AAA+ superfamily ATPase